MTKGKAIIDRENGVSNLEQISSKASENGATVPESVKIAGSVSRTGVTSSRQYWDTILAAAGGLSFVALGFYAAKRSGVAQRYIETRWCKPWVVRETSRLTARDIINHPMEALQKLKEKPSDALSDVIVAPTLEGRLRDIATATKDTKQNRRMYKNILLHGPLGTGKTFFATKLALQSGMDYAVLNGKDLARIGEPLESVPALNKVFDWAETSRRGLLLVFEEADGLLRERSRICSSENLRAIREVFLCRTGEKTNKFMVVLASDKPEQFDSVVNDWLDERVQFHLPGIKERERLIRLYFDEYVLQSATEDKRRLAQFDYGALCVKMARITEGMSLKDLSSIKYFWRASVFYFENGDLTEQMFIDKCLKDITRQKEMIICRSDDPNKKTIYSQRVS